MNPVLVVAAVTLGAMAVAVAVVFALICVTGVWQNIADGRWRDKAGYTGSLTYRVLVPEGPDGRPGETLLAPSSAKYVGHMTKTGVRRDFEVMLGRRSSLWVECIDRGGCDSDPLPGPGALLASERSPRRYQPPFARSLTTPAATTFLGKPALSFGYTNRRGQLCIQWRFTHSGWQFAAGVERDQADGPHVAALADAVLNSWRWLDEVAAVDNATGAATGAKVTLIGPADTSYRGSSQPSVAD